MRLVTTSLFCALLCRATVAPAAVFHVASSGDDHALGTQEEPFATVGRAQKEARRFAAKEPVTIWFRSGTYYLPETIVFAPEDSGTAEAPVVYAAAPSATPVLSGGRRLELNWEPHRNGILKATTPAGLVMDQLFVNGVRQLMARYPNHDANIRPYGGYAADAFSRERAVRWADPAGGFIHAMHRAHWGGYHYRITGKNADGEVTYEGGWQNNRQMGMHKEHRYVENIFEELDAPGEWFHNAKTATLYYKPTAGVDLGNAVVEVVRLRHLIEFQGTPENPVRHVALQGFVFRHAARTFMDVKEPLLRSDWTIYRGGAVWFNGAEDCSIADCEFDQMGGNAVLVNNYNRRIAVRGCDFHDTGASAVVFVGDPKAVRNPLFEYHERQSYDQIDRTSGPQSHNYPADCVVEDCLIRGMGVIEKQATGVQISMSEGITLRHCSIYDASRAGINISEGTFGGHVIEFCDVFDTVRETGDHGSFNSWGRDRFWGLKDAPADELPQLARLDMVRPNVIRNSRWRCDRGWDVDLDDGSSNYKIYNNLFLNGGLKLREGFHRHVWNNIAINNSLNPHVWYDNSQDVVTNNIWMGAYRPAGGMPKGRWGNEIDRNLFATSEADRTRFAAHGCDTHSLVGDPLFVDPANGDFRVRENSPARRLGFQNFPMNQFGVQKPALKAIARQPEIPELRLKSASAERVRGEKVAVAKLRFWQGALIRNLEGDEYSAFGVSKESGGVHLQQVPPASPVARAGLQAGDLIQSVNGQPSRTIEELLAATNAAEGRPVLVGFVRGQAAREAQLRDYVWVMAESAPDANFKRFSLARSSRGAAIQSVRTAPGTVNEPAATLHDGELAKNYGPVFPNGVTVGRYKIDLGRAVEVAEVCTWSFHLNAKRGPQRFTLYGSAADSDPGWDVADSRSFTPIAEVRVAAGERFLATAVRRRGQSLGTFRWLVWATEPVTAIGENTAFQEFQVLKRE